MAANLAAAVSLMRAAVSLVATVMVGAEARRLLDGCWHVFLDAGANIGIHSRFLFEPERFPKSQFRIVFDTYFGADRDAHTTCAVSFEPNPTHRAYHQHQAKQYAARGWRYAPMDTAVGPRAGNLTFYANVRREAQFVGSKDKVMGVGFGVADREGLGAGIYQRRTPQQRIVRHVIDFAAFVMEEVAGRKLPATGSRLAPAVVVKMDIEGVEFALVPRLLETRALCAVNFLSVEWHCKAKFLPLHLEAADGTSILVDDEARCSARRNALRGLLMSQAAGSSCAGHFELSDIDDESYWNERLPAVRTRLCSGEPASTSHI